jgi:STE24 endopeptidase
VERADGAAVCETAVARFTAALSQIAELNGIAAEARSWRHSSIASRIRQLERFAKEPAAVARFDRKLRAIKIVLFIATAIASGIALRIYWPF